MLRASQLDVDRALLLEIDLQETLLTLIPDHQRIVAATRKLLEGARVFRLPVLATEQYPKGLGKTHASIRAALDASDATLLEKQTFSARGDEAVRTALDTVDRPQVILVGIEAHICVQQTALDLVAGDYDVFVCADAVGSRGAMDYEASLSRMRQEGVLVTSVESVLFELCNRCDTAEFKELIEIIKAAPPD
ncbi:MAG: isochorismatase family protein [Phycisphaerae bacterium]